MTTVKFRPLDLNVLVDAGAFPSILQKRWEKATTRDLWADVQAIERAQGRKKWMRLIGGGLLLSSIIAFYQFPDAAPVQGILGYVGFVAVMTFVLGFATDGDEARATARVNSFIEGVTMISRWANKSFAQLVSITHDDDLYRLGDIPMIEITEKILTAERTPEDALSVRCNQKKAELSEEMRKRYDLLAPFGLTRGCNADAAYKQYFHLAEVKLKGASSTTQA